MGETKTITPDLKAQCIQEALDIKNAAAVARRHGLAPRVVQDWVQAAVKQGATEDPRSLKKSVTHLSAENRHLKEILGEKDLEIAILQDLLKKAPRVPPSDVK